MFVGWIRRGSFLKDLEQLSLQLLIDKNLLQKTVDENPSLSFGVYDTQNNLLSILTAYEFDNSILINNLYYTKEVEKATLERLFQVFLNNCCDTTKSILLLSKDSEKRLIEKFGFLNYCSFTKVSHSGAAVAFNFSNATSKSISNPHYFSVVKKLDFDTFKEDRVEYILHKVAKQSSLMLSTSFGFQHSYALSKEIIKISPWIMVDEAFTDAEKLIRGVLYHRGLKKIIAFFPSNQKEIADLYHSYKFEFEEGYSLMYLNEKPNWNLASLYAF